MMDADLVTNLLTVLGRSLDKSFNLFDVMHHGTHEKQLSNIFAWLLDVGGTHQLGDQFVRIFINAVNNERTSSESLPMESYRVRQEVNVGQDAEIDIADLVLESDTARVVIENYFTSDGHGHSYAHYLAYSRSDDRQGMVVLLCREEDRSRLAHGWENAIVVTYSTLIEQLYAGLPQRFQHEHPDVHFFIEQLHQQFVAERNTVGDQEVLEFVTALIEAGEAERYAATPHSSAAERFASDVAVQARQRFVEGRELLRRLKHRLRSYSQNLLRGQLEAELGAGSVHQVSSSLQGVYQWCVVLEFRLRGERSRSSTILLMFGPTAHFITQQDSRPQDADVPQKADYSKLFVTRQDTGTTLQSELTLQEILQGVATSDTRLRDEVLRLLRHNELSQTPDSFRQ
jgi:hypothetical protein